MDFSVKSVGMHGYDQRGGKFRHPNSESGSFSTSIKDGRVHALSPNDLLYTGHGGGAHDAFSTFVALKHGGNTNAALKDAGDNYLLINGESYNRVKRPEYAKEKKQRHPSKSSLRRHQKTPFRLMSPAYPAPMPETAHTPRGHCQS